MNAALLTVVSQHRRPTRLRPPWRKRDEEARAEEAESLLHRAFHLNHHPNVITPSDIADELEEAELVREQARRRVADFAEIIASITGNP